MMIVCKFISCDWMKHPAIIEIVTYSKVYRYVKVCVCRRGLYYVDSWKQTCTVSFRKKNTVIFLVCSLAAWESCGYRTGHVQVCLCRP